METPQQEIDQNIAEIDDEQREKHHAAVLAEMRAEFFIVFAEHFPFLPKENQEGEQRTCAVSAVVNRAVSKERDVCGGKGEQE